MTAGVAERLELELRQLQSLLLDSDRVLSHSLMALAEHVDEHGQVLEALGDARQRARRTSVIIDGRLRVCAREVEQLAETLPRLAQATAPLLADMQAMIDVARKVEELSHITLVNALNAAAVAQRAGAAGAAFGVVAKEAAALPARATRVRTEVQSAIAGTSQRLQRVAEQLQYGAQIGARAAAAAAENAAQLGDEIREHGRSAAEEVARSVVVRRDIQTAVSRAQAALTRLDAGRPLIRLVARRLREGNAAIGDT